MANAGTLLWILNKAGLVQSLRGTKGGYHLSRPASTIHLSEIIKVLDEDKVSGHCKSYTGVLDVCVHAGDCGIRPVILNLHEIVQNALSEVTLAQLVGTEANVDAALHQIVGNALAEITLSQLLGTEKNVDAVLHQIHSKRTEPSGVQAN